ncbi:MAG TPA: hypothetical protein VLC09_15365, partial [Polyangiaceae bacterium]|nr:hypothetical protein [Polyangiaceae bacterium]
MRSLVSIPEEHWLSQAVDADTREATLIVPELPAARVRYFRCLVDDGQSSAMREHAVVWNYDGPPDSRALVRTVLRLRQPHSV